MKLQKKKKIGVQKIPALPQETPALPYMFDLPDDLPQVKAAAMVQAFERAITDIRDSTRLTEQGLAESASHLCDGTAALIQEGKQGTNDLELFQQMYTDTFKAHYPVALQKILSKEIVLDCSMPNAERAAFLDQYGEEVLAELLEQEQEV